MVNITTGYRPDEDPATKSRVGWLFVANPATWRAGCPCQLPGWRGRFEGSWGIPAGHLEPAGPRQQPLRPSDLPESATFTASQLQLGWRCAHLTVRWYSAIIVTAPRAAHMARVRSAAQWPTAGDCCL